MNDPIQKIQRIQNEKEKISQRKAALLKKEKALSVIHIKLKTWKIRNP